MGFLITVFFLLTLASGGLIAGAVAAKSKSGIAQITSTNTGMKEIDSTKMQNLYGLYNNYYRRTNYPVKKPLEEIFVTASALIEKSSKVGTEAQKRNISYQLNYLFEKLIEVLRPEYYYEIKTRPTYWDNPKELALQVESAVISVNKELHKNMRLLNSSQELDFKVNLKILNGKGESDAVKDIYNTNNEKEEK